MLELDLYMNEIKDMWDSHSFWGERAILFLGFRTLGIYKIDFAFKNLLFDWFRSFGSQDVSSQILLLSLSWIVFRMTLGSLCIYVLQKLPGIKVLV